MEIIFASSFFLYVGVENTIGGWAATHARQMGVASGLSTLMPMMFYAALLAVRAAAPFLFRVVSARLAAKVGLALAALGMIGLISVSNPIAMAVSLSLIGAGLATVFPTIISILTEAAGPRSARITPPMFAISNLGAASLPWLVGFLN